MPETPPAMPEGRRIPARTTRQLGPFAVTYTSTQGTWDFHLGALLLIATAMVIGVHEGIYREIPPNGGAEFPFLGLLSHFGADMFALGVSLAFMAVVFEHWRDQ